MIPKSLLNKKEPLSDDDKEAIKRHPLIAAREILEPVSSIVDIIPIIEKHHENWNGTGYPNNLTGENIPIESQIIMIVDSYFALMENRPYRNALTQEEAIKTIEQESGQKWNEKLVHEFVMTIQGLDF
jgi:HD-GYP domain-containing protein (c-di-GMP phosphodiesterase class II)